MCQLESVRKKRAAVGTKVEVECRTVSTGGGGWVNLVGEAQDAWMGKKVCVACVLMIRKAVSEVAVAKL